MLEAASARRWKEDEAARKVRRVAAFTGLLVVACLASSALILAKSGGGQATNIALGAFAGAVAATVAFTLRPGGLDEFSKTVEKYGFLAGAIPIVGGFGAGGFSVLLAVALVGPGGDPASVAVLGGLYGLILGGWVSRVFTPAEGVQATVGGALVEAVGNYPSRHRVNYIGEAVAIFTPPKKLSSFVLGQVQVRFVSEDEIGVEYGNESPWYIGGDPVSGPIRIEDGTDAPEIIFDLTILLAGSLDAYPRTQAVPVPTNGASTPVEFTITSARYGDDADSDEPRAQAPDFVARTLLVDVSQAGRTLQILEVDLPKSSTHG